MSSHPPLVGSCLMRITLQQLLPMTPLLIRQVRLCMSFDPCLLGMFRLCRSWLLWTPCSQRIVLLAPKYMTLEQGWADRSPLRMQ